MRLKILLMAGLSGAIFTGISMYAIQPYLAMPLVTVSNAAVNLGEVRKGVVIKHTFRVFNYTLQPVEVIGEPGCGCTELNMSKICILPFRGIDITAKIDTRVLPVNEKENDFVLNIKTQNRNWEEAITEFFKLVK
jgi:hypothetical protein